MLLGFIVSKRGIEANPEKIATIAQHPEPLLGTPGGYTHPWEGPLVIAKVLKLGTNKPTDSQGEVYTNTSNIQQLHCFYPKDMFKIFVYLVPTQSLVIKEGLALPRQARPSLGG